MQKWDVDPDLVAAMVVEQYPFEAELIVLDFLEGAANADDPLKTLFWTIVMNQVEHMQMQLAADPDHATEVGFGAEI